MLELRRILRLCVTIAVFHAACSQQAVLPIPTPPSLVESLPATTHYYSPNPGETLTLPCVATGVPKPDYEWRFNDVILSDTPAHDGTLIYESPDLSKQGYYQCTARNSLGAVKSNKTLVRRAEQASFDQTATIPRATVVGQRFVLPCQPRRNAVPIPRETFYNKGYDWRYEDGSSYPLGRRAMIDDNGNLNIAYVTLTDNRPASPLTCFITNRISNVNVGGGTTLLTVRDDGTASATRPAIMFYTNMTLNPGRLTTTVVALETRNVSLRCFFSGSADISVSWTKTNGQIPTDGRVEQLSVQTELFIKNVQLSDEGTYVCTGTGAGGSTDFPVRLIVQAAPMFKIPGTGPRDTNATVGEDVTFNCLPYANPDASVIWFRNGIALDLDDERLAYSLVCRAHDDAVFQTPTTCRTSGRAREQACTADTSLRNRFGWSNNNRVLTILKVCKDNCSALDNGPMVIQCNASNEYGYSFTNGYLNVFVRTVLTRTPQGVEGVVGSTYSFNVSGTSDPNTPVMYTWHFKKNDKSEEQQLVTTNTIVISQDGKTLTVKVDESVYGSYRVMASNGISQQSHPFEITRPSAMAYVWPYWWIPLIVLLLILIFIIIVIIVCCCIYRNRGDEYPVHEKEIEADRNPEQELIDNGFQVHHRPTDRQNDVEKQPLTLEKR